MWASVLVSVHVVPHCVRLEASQCSPQLPFAQVSPAPHGLLQPPQLAESVSRSTQALPQRIESLQAVPHEPSEHTCPEAQA